MSLERGKVNNISTVHRNEGKYFGLVGRYERI